ncbi:hypothetical protein SAMN05216270_10138 [Glycomyces harbinensis]|uniref:Uncharacterized protein n=1 Tax=Glycomyces harbinensis TaxID=58114 RepID=A0A1G6QQ14_9ACTN|nr:hypothetical protein SAMN05216270_10138 [Glycomyces harbinensis]
MVSSDLGKDSLPSTLVVMPRAGTARPPMMSRPMAAVAAGCRRDGRSSAVQTRLRSGVALRRRSLPPSMRRPVLTRSAGSTVRELITAMATTMMQAVAIEEKMTSSTR